MPLTLANMDDQRFPELVEEAISLLPRYAPTWTNHNPSDPGITLIELLAYFSEMQIYRLNRISRANKIKFLQLLRKVEDGEKDYLASPSTPIKKLDAALDRTVLALRKPQRAVTAEDYERLVQSGTAATAPDSPLKRVKCFMRTDLEAADGQRRGVDDCPGHISVVIVPDNHHPQQAIQAMLAEVRNEIEDKRLLTTRVHVVGPRYLFFSICALIHSVPGADPIYLQEQSRKKLERFFHPLPDPETGNEGWAFGRSIYLSEVYEQLDGIEGVDFVEDIRVLRLSATHEVQTPGRDALGVADRGSRNSNDWRNIPDRIRNGGR